MDDHELDVLLDQLRQSAAPGTPPQPDEVWWGVRRTRAIQAQRRFAGWMVGGIAAALLLGIGIGRRTAPSTGLPSERTTVSAGAHQVTAEDIELDLLAERSAVLFNNVVQRDPMLTDSAWAASVMTLLWTTRQLLETPSLGASQQAILQDLELVLVQLLGVSHGSDPVEMDLAREAIQLRDLVPRLTALRVTAAARARSAEETT